MFQPRPVESEITLGRLSKRDHDAALALVAEPFDGRAAQSLWRCHATSPNLFVTCRSGGELVGICFGYPAPSTDDEAILEAIVVTRRLRRHRIGSRLLEAFEQAAHVTGSTTVALACTEPDVERFYAHNGYIGRGYLFVVPAGVEVRDLRHVAVLGAWQTADGDTAIDVAAGGLGLAEARRLARRLSAVVTHPVFVKRL